MANLTESPIYEPGIFQLEKSTPPLGGAPVIDNGVPSAGHANAQGLQLANRTAWLKQQVDAISDIDTGFLAEAIAARDDSEAFAVTGLGYLQSSQAIAIQTNQDKIDAEASAEAAASSAEDSLDSATAAQTAVNSLQPALNFVAQDAAYNSSLYKREKFVEVGFRDTYYDQLITTYSYTYLYPQQICIDSVANELWILKRTSGGSNTWAWIWVYDLTTLTIKSVFATSENWKEGMVLRRVGATRYVYTIGNNNDVIRFNVTTLPSFLATPSVDTRYSVSAYSMLAFDGSNWFVQDVNTNYGLTARNIFKVYDAEFTTQTGKFALPLSSVGTIQDYINNFPHMQTVCMHKGSLYASVGGAYVPASNSADKDFPYYLLGIHAFTAMGEKQASALSAPDTFVTKMSELCGYTATCGENEGIASNGNDLLACWITLGPSERVSTSYAGKGVVITRELAKSKSRVDFTPTTKSTKTLLDQSFFSTNIWSSATQLTNPITGEALTTFAAITSMMRQLAIPKYSFGGTNQTLTDLNGVSVAVTGRLVTFETTNGSTFFVSTLDTSGNLLRYGISGVGTTPTQLGPFNNGGEFGTNANGYYFKHANGELICVFTNSTGLACTTARGALFSSDAYVWTYPFPFATDRPIVTVNACYGLRWGGTTALPAVDSCSAILFATASDATARTFQLVANGRWK